MILDEERQENGFRTIFIRSYLNENFIEKQIKLYLNQFIPHQINFTSYKFGTSIWKMNSGITEANSWESENQLIEKSNLTKHFQASFENLSASEDYAIQNIIPDVLSSLLDKNFADKLSDLVFKNINFSSEEWKSIFENYKICTNEFLKNFLDS